MVILGVFLIVNMGGMKMIEWLFEMYFGRVVFFIFIFFYIKQFVECTSASY